MESMENIVNPDILNDGQINFRSWKAVGYERGYEGCQDILKMELVVYGDNKASISRSKSKSPREHYYKPNEFLEYTGDFSDTEQLVICNHNYKDKTWDKSKSVGNFSPRPAQNTVRNQQHIAHRTCKKRICDICRPEADKSHHKLDEPVDSTLFFRWEKAYDKQRTPSMFLRRVKYTVNGLGQVNKVVDNKTQGKVKESTEVMRSRLRLKLDTLKGHKVIARWDQDGLYYPAVVLKCPDPRHALIRYDSGCDAQILTRNIILTGGAVARPQLQAGDYVMMRVVNLDTNDECYVPAVIQCGPQKREAQAKFYTVMMYNGQKASTLRTFLVKISKERFELSSMYICHQQNEDKQEADAAVHVTPRPIKTKPAKWKKEKVIEDEPARRRTPSIERPPSRDGQRSNRGSVAKDIDGNVMDSSRSAASVDGRMRELERLLAEIKEREDKQERRRQKLKKRAKKLARWEQELEAKKYVSEEEISFVKIPRTPSPDSSDEEVLREDDIDHSPTLLQLRKSLRRLRPGEEVTARWSDDGWYYRGMVKHDHEDYSYDLEDSTGHVERIWREDIISENDNPNQILEDNCKVIALHPDYDFSYAPGTVIDSSGDQIIVEFYDMKRSSRPCNEVYPSSSVKHEMDVEYIHKQEERLIGAAVIARDDDTGAFYPGSVIKRGKEGSTYVVGWTDGSEIVQKSIFIFSAFTRRPPLSNGDRVLALADPLQIKFLPGFLMGSSEEHLVVKFCDGEISEFVDPASCYWLGKAYYDDAVEYYKAHNTGFY